MGYTATRRGVAIRAAETRTPATRRRAHPSDDAAGRQRAPESTTRNRGTNGTDAALVRQHEGRDRRSTPDSRVGLDPARSRCRAAGLLSTTADERALSGSAAVFHDAHAPPAVATFGSDAAGHRS
jgi:hypothetical protein